MKILLIGKNGQVGWELQRSLSTLGDVVAVDYFDKELCGDLTNLDGIAQTVRTVRPDVVVNAAAHTAVDKAESERELSDLLNDKGVAVLAAESAKLGALMVHYSTDYVFDGAGSHYRREDEATGPLNVYGETKRAGELALEHGNPRHLIFRTSWVYATRGANFAKTMLRLAGEKETLSIIDDQHGAPTGAELLADCTATAIRETLRDPALAGTYHLVASGETSWCDYARYVFEVARAHGAELAVQEVKGIPTTAYPTPAKRPIAGDVRRGEVGLAHSSGEAGEQPERSGVSGAKERGQGERGTATHAPDTEPGKHVTEAVTRAGSCEAAEERTVYSIVPPADSRSTGSRIPLPEQESGRRSGWHQVDGLRRKHEEQHNRSAPEATSGQLQGAARQASLHPKSGWKTTPARHRLAGGQDRPVCAGENPERSL